MLLFIFLLTILTQIVGSATDGWKYKFTELEHMQNHGYRVEIHYIITNDGYILITYRIPFGVKCDNYQPRKSSVVLWPAMLSSSIDFVSNNESLGYLLADDCYDVWMPNPRGTAESNSNIVIRPNQKEFWAFSSHEVGAYDVPAVVDYVINHSTFKRLFYVGHGQGSTVFFIYASLYPDQAAEKVMYMQALAPSAFLNHMFNPFIRILVPFSKPIQAILKFLGYNKFLPIEGRLHRILYDICRINLLGNYGLCANIFFAVIGPDYTNFNSKLLRNITEHVPAGTSIKTADHFAQMIKSGRFQQYDYGKGNLEKYGSSKPPLYPIENITVPMKLYYGKRDWLISSVDVKRFAKVTQSEMVDCGNINHGDFLWAKNVRTLINEPIIATFNEFLIKNVGLNKTNLN